MQMTVQECYESMGSDFEGVLGAEWAVKQW